MNEINIYDLAYEILLNFLEEYPINSSETSQKEMVAFFFGASSKYDSLFDNYPNIDYATIKQVMLLIMISNAYLTNIYDIKRGINTENAEDIIEMLEGMNNNSIIKLFKDNLGFSLRIFEDCHEYLYNSYIFRYFCWMTAIKENKLRNLIKLNPFIIFENQDNDLGDGFRETEMIFQLFNDLYGKALNDVEDSEVIDEEYEPDEVESNSFNKSLYEYFWQLVRDHFNHDEKKIEDFCAAILGSVYECLNIYAKDNEKIRSNNEELLEMFETMSKDELINLFLNDYSFTLKIIDYFISYNDLIEKGDLIRRRKKFLKKGNIDRLAELNPFYKHEQQVLNRLKKDSN